MATFLFEVVQTTSLLPPLVVLTEAFSFTVLPFVKVPDVLSSLTLVTLPFTTFTVTTAFNFLFFAGLTIIFAIPAFFPVITPLLVTVATFVFELSYVAFLFAVLFGVTLTVVFKVAFFPFASLIVLLPVSEFTEVTFLTFTFGDAFTVPPTPAITMHSEISRFLS